MDRAVSAPEIDRPGLQWFNVPAPLSLAALRGKLVILDFWTFCCINCLQIVPSLKRIEDAFPDEVVVIGVHSPKFAAERESHNLRHAIARYRIEHPVVHDPGFTIWRAYGVRAWPTLVFIAPDGKVIGHAPGEPDPDRLFEVVGKMVADARGGGILESAPLALIPPDAAGGTLAFPGKIKPLRAADGARLWALADSGHHQVVLLDDSGREVRRFGSGKPGLADGDGGSIRFNNPQGLVGTEEAIFVADTFNHAIRRIGLSEGRVETLAGNGRQGPALDGEIPAEEALLASVWDLEVKGSRLFFANAGTHQLGELELERGAVRRLAGTGGEDIVDGPAGEALLAQPSGLALDGDGRLLYFADSESSAVRAVTLDDRPRVETLVGTGLFDFGHVNGSFAKARLQHPLGLTWVPGKVIVADSYNGAVRVVDLENTQVEDLDDGDFLCEDPVCLPAGEPAGVAADGPDRLLLSDTNNHRVLEYQPLRKSYRTWRA
ncbi:MAG: thioredoxin-like domain-containing protein [Alphaproteobacteria bacterium]